MKLSDRLVEARFTKRADGRWDYELMPLLRRRILIDEDKTAFSGYLKLVMPGFVAWVAGHLLALVTFPIAAAIVAMGIMSGSMSEQVQRVILWVGVLPAPISGIYLLFCLIRAAAGRPRKRVSILSAEKGDRVGYFESLATTGKVLGRVYTLLIIAACASGLISAGLWGFMTSSILEELIVPVIVIATLLPLFRSGLRSNASSAT